MSADSSSRARGGDKRSSWQTFRRRLFLVRRLVRGPADGATLVAEANAAFPDVAEGIYTGDSAAALRHDLAALRDEFGCVIRREGRSTYHLDHPGSLALLDLPDAELEALAFLIAEFAERQLPNAPQMRELARRVLALMPADRQQQLARVAAHPRLDQPTAYRQASGTLVSSLKRAVGKSMISFRYQSSYAAAGMVVEHRVAPYDLIYREGHTYLDAYCHACSVPELVSSYVLYRLDRIVDGSLTILPTQLPPGAPLRRTYRLRYHLSAQVAAQRDVAGWFPASQISFADDGSAEVVAETSDLWRARQILLRYREHCRVDEPPELVTLMRASIAAMARLYRDDDSTTEHP